MPASAAPNPHIIVSDPLVAAAGSLVVEAIRSCVRRSGRCRLGLSGGSTPGPTLSLLADRLAASEYSTLWVTWVDERCVPLDHPDSNFKLAKEAWFDRAAARPAEVLPLDCDAAAAFSTRWGGALDVALLGAGPDGHFASLFPGHAALSAPGPIIEIEDSPKPPPHRLTMSLSVLQATSEAILLARGANKAEALAAALRGSPTVPLGRYRPAGKYTWVLDPEAASHLEATRE